MIKGQQLLMPEKKGRQRLHLYVDLWINRGCFSIRQKLFVFQVGKTKFKLETNLELLPLFAKVWILCQNSKYWLCFKLFLERIQKFRFLNFNKNWLNYLPRILAKDPNLNTSPCSCKIIVMNAMKFDENALLNIRESLVVIQPWWLGCGASAS